MAVGRINLAGEVFYHVNTRVKTRYMKCHRLALCMADTLNDGGGIGFLVDSLRVTTMPAMCASAHTPRCCLFLFFQSFLHEAHAHAISGMQAKSLWNVL